MSIQDQYNELNEVERRIVDNWVQSGISLKQAIEDLNLDLEDAVIEDGYDGP